MYFIFHEPTERNFGKNPMIRQFRQIEAEDCEWMTRYLLCQDVILNQMTDQTNYVRQGNNEQMLDKQISNFQAPDHDKIIGQGHDLYDPKLV